MWLRCYLIRMPLFESSVESGIKSIAVLRPRYVVLRRKTTELNSHCCVSPDYRRDRTRCVDRIVVIIVAVRGECYALKLQTLPELFC